MQVKDNPNPPTTTPSRVATALEPLYPQGSIIGDIVDLTRKNTDLPTTAAVFGAYSRIATALAQAGFTHQVEGGIAASPNLPLAVIVGDDADGGYVLREIVDRVICVPQLCEVPGGTTSASFFAHAQKHAFPIGANNTSSSQERDANTPSATRCLSLLRVVDGEDWLKALHREANLAKLRRQLLAGCHGERLHQWTPKDGDQFSPPVHLSLLFASRQSPFFAELAGHFFSSALIEQLLIVLCNDRPADRMALYGTDGIAAAAKRWKGVWAQITAGPPAYRATAEAIAEYQAWWIGRLKVNRHPEQEIRQVGHAVWKYALVIQTLLDARGSIGVEALRTALSIADRHLADRAFAAKRLASETADERLARKVAKHMTDNPTEVRGDIMHNVHGAADPAALNRALVLIAELNPDTLLAKRAMEFRAASRAVRGDGN